MLYKIGDFSKLVDASVRTLRYYDEIDLLKPKEIDLFTGYRYYSKEQIEEFKVIKELQEANFSLDEIKDNWDMFNNGIMLEKKNQLLKEIEDVREKIKKVDYLRSNIDNGKIVLSTKENVVTDKIKSIYVIKKG